MKAHVNQVEAIIVCRIIGQASGDGRDVFD